jgi:predicted  nucleic acid-binding Zn-ribbon protein
VSLLYADPDLAARIATARDRQRQTGHHHAGQLPTRSLITEQSLRAELANTKEQIRQLTADLTLLRERLTHQLGADADIARGRDLQPWLTQLERRAAELEADNHQLRRQVTELTDELRDLNDTLDAARTTNRDLMNELNRDAAPRRLQIRGSTQTTTSDHPDRQ